MDDVQLMRQAMAQAAAVRFATVPNPWVGCVIVPTSSGSSDADTKTKTNADSTANSTAGGDCTPVFEGATAPPGGPHAEVAALTAAGDAARGATLFVTLEPCVHHGRTPPCSEAIVAAGVTRVVIGVEDPDPRVSGRGVAALRDAGIDVSVGVAADEVVEQLAPYLKHRSTGQPWVILKMAASLDARTAAPDAHALRPRSDAVLVGAGTVRADDPELTVRLEDGLEHTQPLRVVLGQAPAGARVHPALELAGELDDVLTELGRRGVIRLLVEGGATVAHDFHVAGLVDRYVLYLAPMFFGGDDGRPIFAGPGAGTIADVWKGKLVSVELLGEDLRVEVAA